jgi:hypothetical protein
MRSMVEGACQREAGFRQIPAPVLTRAWPASHPLHRTACGPPPPTGGVIYVTKHESAAKANPEWPCSTHILPSSGEECRNGSR